MNANDQLAEHFSSDEYFPTIFKGLVYSEGAQALFEKFKCYWFLDIVVSYQIHPKVRKEEFQVWKLKKTGDSTAIVICEDGNDNKVVSQKIPFTDFEAQEATLWVENKVIYLPSER